MSRFTGLYYLLPGCWLTEEDGVFQMEFLCSSSVHGGGGGNHEPVEAQESRLGLQFHSFWKFLPLLVGSFTSRRRLSTSGLREREEEVCTPVMLWLLLLLLLLLKPFIIMAGLALILTSCPAITYFHSVRVQKHA